MRSDDGEARRGKSPAYVRGAAVVGKVMPVTEEYEERDNKYTGTINPDPKFR